MRWRFGLSLLAFSAGVALLVSAAFAGPHRESRRGGTLRLMWGVDPDYVDPALATGTRGSWTMLFATCAKLFNTLQDPDTGRARIAPEVAQGFPRISRNGLVYTFELKRTFRFHTGARVTAQSFADAFNRNAKLKQASFVSRRGFMEEIVGANAVISGKATTISGVQVLGRYRLRVRLKQNAGDFVARSTMPSFCPILPRTPLDPKGMDKPPGSGPYYVAERVPNRRIVLERNPFYRGARIANPDRIVWTIDPDRGERLRATEQDQNDFTPLFDVPDAAVRNLVDKYGLNRLGGRFLRLPSLSTYLFAFNDDRPVFRGGRQAPLRKAINYALDRHALVKAHSYLSVRRTDRLLPAPLSRSRGLYPLGGPDPITAQRWLARAARRPQTLTLYTANFGFAVPTAQVFVANMKQLGIEVTPKYFDFVTLSIKLNTKGEPWDVAWLPWGAWYADPAGSILPLLRGSRYEARINAANRATGAAARAKSWADVETDLMHNDPPVAVYADVTPLILVSRSFSCFNSLQGYEVDLAAACKK